jgi:hypothetical protein
MNREYTRDNKNKNNFNSHKSNGGSQSKAFAKSTVMQQKAKAQQNMFGSAIVQKKENKTGLPTQLKNGIESLSGYDMSDVKVHRNSSKPAQVNAHAYAQGTDVVVKKNIFHT